MPLGKTRTNALLPQGRWAQTTDKTRAMAQEAKTKQNKNMDTKGAYLSPNAFFLREQHLRRPEAGGPMRSRG